MKEDRHQRFMQREAKMRAIVRKAKQDEGIDINSQGKFDAPCISMEASAAPDAKGDGGSSTMDMSDRKSPIVPRPMWALTEEQAGKVVDCAEFTEADNLLDFASNLDFDKYINDSEVSALIENVRARITELEATQTTEAKLELESLDHIVDKSKLRLTAESLDAISDRPEANGSNQEDDCVSVARTVLDSDAGKKVGAIHSHKSLTALAQRSKNAAKESEVDATIDEDVVPQPIVVKHTEDAGARLEGKNCVSNLPYMHRNPAV